MGRYTLKITPTSNLQENDLGIQEVIDLGLISFIETDYDDNTDVPADNTILSRMLTEDFQASQAKNKEVLLERVREVADKETQKAKDKIIGDKLTLEQHERYLDKADLCTQYRADTTNETIKAEVALAAKAESMELEAYVDMILQYAAEFNTAKKVLNSRIEVFRRAIKRLVEAEKYELAQKYLTVVEGFTAETTIDDLNVVLDEILGYLN